ncbi:hypothetical protein GJV85_06500 [Sulfurimonas aquatica]|uniref:DUF5625 domain-containing protein n=1 Tax=Sulfurimonas aquatica TaxID=2672570 RepID=A0A975B058_9BACT|nr:DUF5625 family protein [Sulfurimonas aquatica]QSZ41772.1 hypothetical protein GJV85_06500 [Sulfurimonas aquatica]
MWITSLCTFPPLIEDEPFSIKKENSSISIPFEAPVEKSYFLKMNFIFPTTKARLEDKFIGSRYNQYCQGDINYDEIPDDDRKGLGQPLKFKVIIQEKDGSIVFEKIVESLCRTSFKQNISTRTIASVPLLKGEYLAKITFLEKQNSLGLKDVNTTIRLDAGRWLK